MFTWERKIHINSYILLNLKSFFLIINNIY